MDIKSLLKTVGTAVLATNPIGAAAIPLINKLLPGDETLPDNATGEQVQQRISQLSVEQQVEIFTSKIDLEIEQERGMTARYEAMCKADGQETRAKMVNKAMNCLIALSLIFIAAVAYVYAKDGAKVAFSLEMAAVFGTLSAPFAFVIRSYYGDLRTETESRHSAYSNQPTKPKGLAGIIQAIKN